jgi:hypothetical protein
MHTVRSIRDNLGDFTPTATNPIEMQRKKCRVMLSAVNPNNVVSLVSE